MTAQAYVDRLPFKGDRFQIEAAAAIDGGASVVVTAPTGSGKTVVAEAAIARARERGLRAVYTTPLKALSNQKFGDFRSAYGPERVGLLTGDNSINGSAEVVVMTTEVLRNMMYLGSPDLDDVGVVILDEVHYLQDRARGAVWEEIIIHLDRAIPLVCLSATIANPEEFTHWITERRGQVELIQEKQRPVPLESTYLVRDRWEKGGGLRLMPIFHGSRANERVAKMLRASGRGRRRYGTPRPFETAQLLRSKGLLPAIYFIFSRKGCNDAVDAVVSRGLRLTSSEEAAEIREVANGNTRHLSPQDLAVIGYPRWLRGLEAGVAPHHAGQVPALKETVEQLFAAGLVRLVFATETLALGINMPARTVVLNSLTKFTGDGHELMLPGDYTQLTGRAGRRGIDQEGTAVVLHSPYVEFERVAGIAGAGSHALRSSFRPNYNMVVNLVGRYEREQAEQLLAASFAEFADAATRRDLKARLSRERKRLAAAREAAQHPELDIWELLDSRPEGRDRLLTEFAAKTVPGDVLEWTERGVALRHAVVARGSGKRPRLLTVSERAQVRRIAPDRLPDSVARIGRIDLPKPFRPKEARYRRAVAEALAAFKPATRVVVLSDSTTDPDLARHLAAAREARRIERTVESLRSRTATASPGVLVAFDRLFDVLSQMGYVDGWDLTEKGSRLRRIYSELDLLVAESIDAEILADLSGPSTAALMSSFTYEPRRDASDGTWPKPAAEAGSSVEHLWRLITDLERNAGLPETRSPDPGFAGLAYAWTSGASLAEIFGDEGDASIGDFVRNCRQTIDLLRQVRDIHDQPPTGVVDALRGMDRGVVTAEGVL